MYKVIFMSVMKSAGELDSDIQKSFLNFFLCTFVKSAVLYMAFQASVFHPLRKDCRHFLDLTHVVAGDNIGVKTEIDPMSAFRSKIVFLLRRLKGFRFRSLHSQIHIPSGVTDAPYRAHSPANSFGLHAISIQDHVAGMIVRHMLRRNCSYRLMFFICRLCIGLGS